MPNPVRPTDSQIEFLQKRPPLLGVLGTIGSDGSPHVVPLWYSYDDAWNRFILSTPADSTKVRNLRGNDSATLLVLQGEKYVQVKGKAKVNERAGENATEILAARYMGEAGARLAAKLNETKRVAIELTPEKIISRQV